MLDIHQRRIVVRKYGKNGPYVSVTPQRASDVESLLGRNKIMFFVDSTLSGEAVLFDLGRNADLPAVQSLLDSLD